MHQEQHLTFNIFTYALMLWCHWTPDMDSLALGTRTGGQIYLWWDPNPHFPIRILVLINIVCLIVN